MKKLILSILLFSFYISHAQAIKILWLGNSYTTVNNLPQLFHDLALSAGDTVIFDSYAPGGYTLHQHATDASGIQKIYSQQWDYVVIQAQSQEPSFPPQQVASETYPYARTLDSLIHENDSCTETVFYMTWGKKYGDQQNCGSYPVICTFDGVQDRLRASYLDMANHNDAIVAPAGMAWYASWHTDTLVNLWSSDNSHPSLAGSYLTACVFYGTLFQKSPVGLAYSPLSSAPTNDYLQNIAYHTVFDSLANWNIGVFAPQAHFTYSGNEATMSYQFDGTASTNYHTIRWSFGDNTFGNGVQPTHTYSDTGTYIITEVVSNECGQADSFSQTLVIHPSNNIFELPRIAFTISPNPAKNQLTLTTDESSTDATVTITDLRGKIILERAIATQNLRINTEHFSAGVYFITLTGHEGQKATKQLIIQHD